MLSATNAMTSVHAQTKTNYFLHTVTKGQSLYSIASMYNVSINDIVRMNPDSKQQIKTGQTLKIPQAVTDGDNKHPRFHTIQSGETLYRLTLQYAVSAEAICAANPGLSAKNFRAGQVIIIPANKEEKKPEQPEKSEDTVQQQKWQEMHKVARKETIFSISRQYGITPEELIAANPELKDKKLKRGSFLFIPYPKSQAETSKQTEETTTASQESGPTNEELFGKHAEKKETPSTIKLALLLSFTDAKGIQQDEQSRMIEFYEGFLMAVDSLKRQGVSCDIYTFDTQGTADGVNNILSKSVLKQMDIIFGPVHQQGIEPIADFAEKNKIRVVIPFSPKVEQVFTNPYIYQINTPQSYLYSEVYEHFIRKFKKSNVVFLDDGSGNTEKAEFINGLKNELNDNNIRYKQVKLGGDIDPAKLIAAMDTLQENVFIPTSGSNTALTRLMPQLTLVRKEHPNFDMHLFGYPEWQTYTQDFLANFYEMDTYFYSSFYTNNLLPEAINFTQNYRHWYSKDMANTYPKYGMLGFDIGYFFLKGMSQQGNKLEENIGNVQVTPIQTGFKFERVNNWGGFINRKVFFVHFTKDYELIKIDFE